MQTGPHKDALLRKVISQGLPKMNHHQQYIVNQYCAQEDGEVSFIVNESEFPRNVGLTVTINSIAIAEWLINDGLDIVVIANTMRITHCNFSYAVQKFANEMRISDTKTRCSSYTNYQHNNLQQDILKKGPKRVRIVPASSDHRGYRDVDLLIYEHHRTNSAISNKIRDAIAYNYNPKRIIMTLSQ